VEMLGGSVVDFVMELSPKVVAAVLFDATVSIFFLRWMRGNVWFSQ
jgi:hypothetical protein